MRTAGKVGSSLQAVVTISAPREQPHPIEIKTSQPSPTFSWTGNDFKTLKSIESDLKFVFIVSNVSLSEDLVGYGKIVVSTSLTTKCERCWHYVEDIGSDPEHPTICGRCISNLHGVGESRQFA